MVEETPTDEIVDDNVMDFDSIVPEQVLVKYQKKQYLLCEADGASSAKWRASILAGATYTDGKPSKLSDKASESDMVLIRLCLYNTEDGVTKGTLVHPNLVSGMPGKMVQKLFKRLQKMSGLDETKENKDKKDTDTKNE